MRLRSARRARRRRSRCARAAFRLRRTIANALIAQNGMQATLLAQQGVTGPLDLFEAERGLRVGVPARARGRDFRRAAAGRQLHHAQRDKGFPCFAGGQSAVAAGIALHRLVGGNVDQLKTIRVALAELPDRAPLACRSRPHRPAIARGRRPQPALPHRRCVQRRHVRALANSPTRAGTTQKCAR